MCGSIKDIKENTVATKKNNTEKLFKSGDKIRATKTSGDVTKGTVYTVDRYSAADNYDGTPRLKLKELAYSRPDQSLFESADALPAIEAAPATNVKAAPALPSQYSKALAQVQSLLEAGATGINVSKSLNGSVRVTGTVDATFNA